ADKKRQTKRAAGGQTRIALRRYSNMAPSFPLFLPADEAPHTAWYTLTARFASRWGADPPLGALHTATNRWFGGSLLRSSSLVAGVSKPADYKWQLAHKDGREKTGNSASEEPRDFDDARYRRIDDSV
ncbi:hypothetical protein AB4156_41335, partial [Cupriavidus sp. 2MCAB6]|uniref:hypothetical protein n=1 Tax=Cupriavidus sp. 2MCAB6 TaxID=3232981 RepID=UPI003F933366